MCLFKGMSKQYTAIANVYDCVSLSGAGESGKSTIVKQMK